MINSSVINLLETDLQTLSTIVQAVLTTTAGITNKSNVTQWIQALDQASFVESLYAFIFQLLSQFGVDTDFSTFLTTEIQQFVNLNIISATPGYSCPVCVNCSLADLITSVSMQNCTSASQAYCQYSIKMLGFSGDMPIVVADMGCSSTCTVFASRFDLASNGGLSGLLTSPVEICLPKFPINLPMLAASAQSMFQYTKTLFAKMENETANNETALVQLLFPGLINLI
jgi:hypothetical protein